MSIKKKILIGVLSIVLLISGFLVYYVNDYYHATDAAITISEKMKVKDGDLYYEGNSDVGFIIYPGGKVDERAYAPLAEELHRNDDTVVIVKMPFRLSILDNNEANNVIDENPHIKKWYIIGHSLGGTSASIFAEKYGTKIEGIVFLGSYAYKDLSESDLKILTITGSKDKVINKDKAEEAKEDYPSDTKHITLDGGNHAYYGEYGMQSGDGDATISPQQQRQQTVNYIFEWINEE